ncbi:MAG: hypothetical protein P8K77_08765 [Polaribacter sp.]|nr:hypothetical protein [Polaribacter sp.]
MFTKGQLIFAGFFIVAFTFLMAWSYRKDIKNHKIYYKNTALKVGFWFVVAIIFFRLINLYLKS